MLTSPFPMWPHEINPVKNILQSILMTFYSLQSHKVIGVRLHNMLHCEEPLVQFYWHLRSLTGKYSFSRWKRWNKELCFFLSLREHTPLIQPMLKKEEKGKKKSPITASDSVSFQSACIRFITFLSLHLVDASRVRLHWYGRGGLSCDYDIFLGALSSHSISLG